MPFNITGIVASIININNTTEIIGIYIMLSLMSYNNPNKPNKSLVIVTIAQEHGINKIVTQNITKID